MNPLEIFYDAAGEPMPSIRIISGADIPEPYHHLLVHQRDMTSVLEAFAGERLELNVLRSSEERDGLSREVILVGETDGRPVEFGAIRIHVGRIDIDAARAEIRAGHRPLGGILVEHGVEHRCEPQAFLEVQSDRLMRESLRMTADQPLFGRHNLLLGHGDVLIAEVMEILPPIG